MTNGKIMIDNDRATQGFDQFYYGSGKLLLSGEYFVLDGAQALALPTKLGQSMGVRYTQSFSPKLTWKSFDEQGNLWFESHYEFWQFKCLDEKPGPEALALQGLLQQARKQNQHFLREEQDVYVETQVGFPLKWGLGSSSSLIHNIAEWAYISPFELLFNTQGGSGYDIACAQSDGPIVYEKNASGPKWSPSSFAPNFSDKLYFVYLGKKQKSSEGIKLYQSRGPVKKELLNTVSLLTEKMLAAQEMNEFMDLMLKHEDLVSSYLSLPKVKDKYFSDFAGQVKSLGAWGGDFVLAASDKGGDYITDYFTSKGHDVVIAYDDLILKTPNVLPNHDGNHHLH